MTTRNMHPARVAMIAGLCGAASAVTPVHAQAIATEIDTLVSLEEVVVTAQKREQRYLDVPVAVSTIGGEVLDIAKTNTLQDLVQVAPSVTFNQSGDMRGVGVLIRGIGTTNFQTAVEPTISAVMDGVPLANTAQFLTDLTDIERVEVLRGPQGTLFGKNASGGLINIVTRRPSRTFQGFAEVTATDDHSRGLKADISGPLSERARGRLSGYVRSYDGFIRNEATGERLNGEKVGGVRGKLEIDVTDRVDLLLIADWSRQDRDCCTNAPALTIDSVINPPTLTTAQTVAVNAFRFDYRDIPLGIRNRSVLLNTPTFSNSLTHGLSAEVRVDFDNFVLTSITAGRKFNLETQQDLDLTPYQQATYGRTVWLSNGATNGGDQDQQQFSQELRVNSTAWDTVNLTAGVFYWNQKLSRYFERRTAICTTPAPSLALSVDPSLTPCTASRELFNYSDNADHSINRATFGQADWQFAPGWTATLGLRRTWDSLRTEFARVNPSGVTGAGVFAPIPLTIVSTRSAETTGKAALQWQLPDKLMLYASYSTGYKAPAFDNITGTTLARLQNVVPPETADSYELGMRSELLDRRVRMGVTLFHTTFHDLQGQSTQPGQIGFVLTTAGTAITRGVELELTAKPLRQLLINSAVSYTDAYFDSFPAANCYTGQATAQGCTGGSQNLAGKPLANAPKWKGAVQARYDIPVNDGLNVFLSTNFRYQTDSQGDQNQDPNLRRKAYGIVDLTLGIADAAGRWEGSLFVKNALNKFYEDLRSRDTQNNYGGVSHYLTRDSQRYLGVDVKYKFGDF